MPKRLIYPALAQFAAATAGRNMTKAAYIAVMTGVAMMALLTVAPDHDTAHHGVHAVLWVCLAYFIYEWLVRLRQAVMTHRVWLRSFSARIPKPRGCSASYGC